MELETAQFEPERNTPAMELPVWLVEWRRLHPLRILESLGDDDGDEAA